MKKVEEFSNKESGFQVFTYEVKSNNDPQKISEIIIAFAGSNEVKDYLKTNSGFSKQQFQDAINYVKHITSKDKYPDKRIVVSGFSLGGALAIHVAKNKETSHLVAEAWALNPSPLINTDYKMNKKIWIAAAKGEILRTHRKNFILIPEQSAQDYYLVKANRIYSHFRWVLTRNMLFAADIAMKMDNSNPYRDEPINILKASKFESCKS